METQQLSRKNVCARTRETMKDYGLETAQDFIDLYLANEGQFNQLTRLRGMGSKVLTELVRETLKTGATLPPKEKLCEQYIEGMKTHYKKYGKTFTSKDESRFSLQFAEGYANTANLIDRVERELK